MPAIPRVLHQGLAADKPTADATLNQGWLYYETDTDMLKQSWNGTWVTINSGSGPHGVVKLDEIVVPGGGAADITFSSISQDYSGLRVEVVGASDTPSAGSGFSFVLLHMQINGDATAAHYRGTSFWLATDGGGAAQNGLNTESTAQLGVGVVADPRSAAPNVPGMTVVQLPNYSDTVFGKIGEYWHVVSPATYLLGSDRGFFWWDQTAAITELVFTPQFGSLIAGTRARLYGFA